MNKYVVLTVLALIAVMPSLVHAEDAKAAEATSAASAPVMPPPPPAAAANGIGFDAQKGQMLKSIGDRMTDLQKKQLCVEAAIKPEDMKECFKPPTGMSRIPGMKPPEDNKGSQ